MYLHLSVYTYACINTCYPCKILSGYTEECKNNGLIIKIPPSCFVFCFNGNDAMLRSNFSKITFNNDITCALAHLYTCNTAIYLYFYACPYLYINIHLHLVNTHVNYP